MARNRFERVDYWARVGAAIVLVGAAGYFMGDSRDNTMKVDTKLTFEDVRPYVHVVPDENPRKFDDLENITPNVPNDRRLMGVYDI